MMPCRLTSRPRAWLAISSLLPVACLWLAVVSAAFVLRLERSTWNESLPHNEDSQGDSSDVVKHGVKRSTWNDFHFVTTVAIAAALAGAVVLSPVVALGVWSLTELVASALTLRQNRQQRLQDSADKNPASTRSQKPHKQAATPAQTSLAHAHAHRRHRRRHHRQCHLLLHQNQNRLLLRHQHRCRQITWKIT